MITLVHTLEHLVRPMDVLKELRAKLTGHVYIEVPNNEPDTVHPLVFTRDALSKTLDLAGFKILEDANDLRNIWVWAE